MYARRIIKVSVLLLIAAFLFFIFSFMTACQPAAAHEATAPEPITDEPATAETITTPMTTAAGTAEASEAEAVEGEIMEEAMEITSPDFKLNETIPSRYTCDGENVNPRLSISGIPENTESLVLIVDDPDAPVGIWVHWTVWNMDPGTTEIAEDSVPAGGVEGVTDFGVPGYDGPCPPSGTHRYFFKVYALDTTLDLDTSATATDIEEAMQGHILDSAMLIGLYGS